MQKQTSTQTPRTGTSKSRAQQRAAIIEILGHLRARYKFVERDLDQRDLLAFLWCLRRAAAATSVLNKVRLGVKIFSIVAFLLASVSAMMYLLRRHSDVPLPLDLTHRSVAGVMPELLGLVAFVVMFGGFAIALNLQTTFATAAKPLRSWLWLSLLLGATGAVASSLHLFPMASDWRNAADGLVLAAIVNLTFMCTLLLGDYCIALAEHTWGNRSPESYIVVAIAAVMESVRGEKWRKTRCKRRALRRLDKVAYAFEKYLPAVLDAQNASVGRWSHNRFREMAALPRELQRWVLSPRSDTQYFLNTELLMLLKRTLRQDWDLIGALPLEAVEPRGAIIRRLLQTSVVAILPSAGVLVMMYFGLLHEQIVSSWLVAAAYVWAIGVALLALDPLLAAKIATVRDLRQIFGTNVS